MNVINSAKDKIINNELINSLVRSKEATLLGYKVSIMNNGLKSLPWLLAGMSKTKILSLSEDAFSFNLFKLLLCKHKKLKDNPSNKLQCACGHEVDLSIAPDHWASCEAAYSNNKFTRHNYCVKIFKDLLKSVVKPKEPMPFLLTTEQRIKALVHNVQKSKNKNNLPVDKMAVYESYITQTIIPDVLLCLQCNVEDDKMLGFDYGKHPHSYLFDVSFMHVAQVSKAKNLIRTLNVDNFAEPFMETDAEAQRRGEEP